MNGCFVIVIYDTDLCDRNMIQSIEEISSYDGCQLQVTESDNAKPKGMQEGTRIAKLESESHESFFIHE